MIKKRKSQKKTKKKNPIAKLLRSPILRNKILKSAIDQLKKGKSDMEHFGD